MRIFPLLGWMLVPGCWAAVTGPRAVSGPTGGSVSVQCRYDEGFERYSKFWCRAGARFCPDGLIAASRGTEAKVKQGRVSLQDNHMLRSFTVTVENLTAADAGTFQCGILSAAFLADHRHAVDVTISPAIHTSAPTGRPPATAEQPGDAASTPITLSVSSNDTLALAQLSNIHFLLLVTWKVPILLCIVGMNVCYRKNSRERPGRHG